MFPLGFWHSHCPGPTLTGCCLPGQVIGAAEVGAAPMAAIAAVTPNTPAAAATLRIFLRIVPPPSIRRGPSHQVRAVGLPIRPLEAQVQSRRLAPCGEPP